jgi:hypothetical protein
MCAFAYGTDGWKVIGRELLFWKMGIYKGMLHLRSLLSTYFFFKVLNSQGGGITNPIRPRAQKRYTLMGPALQLPNSSKFLYPDTHQLTSY